MTDFVVSIFRLSNRRGYSTPVLNIGYQEKGSDVEWQMVTGGTRGYLVRTGGSLSDDLDEQAADSHFMMRRITSSLLLGRRGLFLAEAAGRFVMHGISKEFPWSVHIDKPEPSPDDTVQDDSSGVYDWCTALVTHVVLRRAADDLYAALADPREAFVYLYRGIEWLKQGSNLSWEEFAKFVDIPLADLKELTKMANFERGVRHASKSGNKMRAETPIYGSWACALVDCINAVRAHLEPTFQKMDAKTAAEVVTKALLPTPYE